MQLWDYNALNTGDFFFGSLEEWKLWKWENSDVLCANHTKRRRNHSPGTTNVINFSKCRFFSTISSLKSSFWYLEQTELSLYLPAVHDDGAAEEVLESVDTAPQLQEQMWLPGDAVVRPAHELDVGNLSLWVLLPLLQTHTDSNTCTRHILTQI